MLDKAIEHGPVFLNTIILVCLFWYQKNKNKVLEDRIAEQSALLNETKDVILNQAQAIESQKMVVETALDYTKAFDRNALEDVIRREIEISYKETIQAKDEQLKLQGKEQNILMKMVAMETAKQSADLVLERYAFPLYGVLYKHLLTATKERRNEIYDHLDEENSPMLNGLRSSIEDYHEKKPPNLSLLGLGGPFNDNDK